MAAQVNIVVTKNDGTTSMTYTGVQPSSGDGTPAIWKSQAVGNAQAHQPELRLSARDSANGTSRTLRATGVYPSISTDSTTGITTVTKRSRFSAEWVFDKDTPQTDVDEFVMQMNHILFNTSFKGYIKSGYSAT